MIPMKYVNNRGSAVDLYGNGVVCDPADAIAWDLDAEEVNGKVASFTAGATTKKLTCVTYGQLARRRLYEIPARDVADLTPGRLYVGDWYLRCYVTASSQDRWWAQDGIAKYNLTVTVEDPHWLRDTTYVYTERHEGGRGLDFEYDFSYDYGYAPSTVIIQNDNYLPADAVIRVFGPVTDPSVEIGQNAYSVGVTLEQGDYLEISTADKTVRVVRLTGEVENAFPDIEGEYMEGSGSYVFERVPTGQSDVTWDGNFDFDIVVTERRDEPRWD